MALKARNAILLAKIESSYGVDPTPTGGANAMLIRNLEAQPMNAELVSRDLIRGYYGNSDQLVAAKFSTVSFEIEAAGSGTAGTAPAYDALLKACGFDDTVVALTSVTYAPISSSIPSVTFYFFVDGIRHKITGAVGTFELSFNVKQIPVFRFTFTGIYNAPSDTANPTPTYSGFIAPKVVNALFTQTFNLLSYNAVAESVSFNLGGETPFRSVFGTSVSDYALFQDRKPSGVAVIEEPTVAAKDYWTAAANGTSGSLQLIHGTTAGNIIELNCPTLTIGNPTLQESQGIQMLSIPFTPVPNSGNDELSLIFT